MPTYLSYLQHPLLSSLRLISHIFSGIEMAMVFYYNHENTGVEGHFMTDADNYERIEIMDISEIRHKVLKMRSESKAANWYSPDELEITVNQAKTKQLKIDAEDTRTVLKLSFENKYDKKADLIFIYFKNLLNILPLASEAKPLITKEKSIVQHLLENMLKAFINNELNNLMCFESISQNTRSIISETNEIIKAHEETKENYGNSLLKLCENHLTNAEIKLKKRFTFEFDYDCIQKIKNYKGRIEELESIINDAVTTLANIYYNSSAQHIKIRDYNIHFDKFPNKKVEELKDTGFAEDDASYYYKEISFLNRYEEATKRLISDQKKPTINILGSYCYPKVTGAAISDSLNKYKSSIRVLLKQYPNNWGFLKEHIKPILKIIDSDDSKSQA